MRVLEYPNYVTIDDIKGLHRSRTGYGYMTIDIATALAAKGVQVDLLTQSYLTQRLSYKKVNILRRTWKDILINLKVKHLIAALKTLLKYPAPFTKIPKIIFYYISMGYFETVLKQYKYDFVHIHGIGYYTLPIISICLRKNIKFVVTLHGLNSFSNSINISENGKRIEKDFIKNAQYHDIPVTVISTGIRETILNFLSIKQSDNFKVIPNAFKIDDKQNLAPINIRKKYHLENSPKIMLAIGNIGKNKNQIQIARAYNNLPKYIKEKLVIIFYGHDTADSLFQRELSKQKSTHLIYGGQVPKSELPNIYKQADFTILASISEGFGLSLIEGFAYGLPCITFSNLDAVFDIYSPEAVYLVKERSDDALAKGIEDFINKQWDKKKIKKHAEKFTLDKMSGNYIYYFKSLIV